MTWTLEAWREGQEKIEFMTSIFKDRKKGRLMLGELPGSSFPAGAVQPLFPFEHGPNRKGNSAKTQLPPLFRAQW